VRTFSVQRSAFSVQRSAFSVQRSAFSVQRSAFGVRRSAFGVQRSSVQAAQRLTLTLALLKRLDADGAAQPVRVVGRSNHLESSLGVGQTLRETQALGFFGIVHLGDERL
jgi:hypothetical protein